jgi:hypothetical protein
MLKLSQDPSRRTVLTEGPVRLKSDGKKETREMVSTVYFYSERTTERPGRMKKTMGSREAKEERRAKEQEQEE